VPTGFSRINAKTTIQVLVFFASILFTAAILPLQSVAQADTPSIMNKSSEEIVLQMRDRLQLTEDQVIRIHPIIEESFNKRIEILNSSNGDGKATKSALQQVQWTTDIKLGRILTKEQMEEYQNLREEQRDKAQSSETHRGRGGHSGGMHGF